MSRFVLSSSPPAPAVQPYRPGSDRGRSPSGRVSGATLGAAITRAASAQTYSIIRLLADRLLVADAYRAYAYFRWVDDIVDQPHFIRADRLAFLSRQQGIIERCYRNEWPSDLCPEEELVVDLLNGDRSRSSGLGIYIEQMMAVMAFDAERRGRLISRMELDDYTHALATAVTEALHYFIGHEDGSPRDERRYAAVTGAHVIHMLRDAIEDTAVGYYNIPRDYLDAHAIIPEDVNHDAYRAWVQHRTQLARRCFAQGRTYLAGVKNRRCRLAGYAYIARFEWVLDTIENDGYRLRSAYPERKSKKATLKMGWAALRQMVASSLPTRRRRLKDAVLPLEAVK